MHHRDLLQQLADYARRYPLELGVVEAFRELLTSAPDCFERRRPEGHVTGSAWLMVPERNEVLLTHHRKLNIWVQLGGHADGDPDVRAVALREAREESGLDGIELINAGIFDLDIHPIPANAREAAHLHYDIRYAFRVTATASFRVSDESHDLAWVPLTKLEHYSRKHSLLRMRDKWLALSRTL